MWLRTFAGLTVVTWLGFGCGAPKQVGDDFDFDVKVPESQRSGSNSSSEDEPVSDGESGSSWETAPTEDQMTQEQKDQIKIALRRGGDKAAQCSSVVEGAETGEGEVQVVMDGQKGRVIDVVVGPPFAGTNVESCIKRSFVGEIILPFDGAPTQVPYTVKIEPKGKGKK